MTPLAAIPIAVVAVLAIAIMVAPVAIASLIRFVAFMSPVASRRTVWPVALGRLAVANLGVGDAAIAVIPTIGLRPWRPSEEQETTQRSACQYSLAK